MSTDKPSTKKSNVKKPFPLHYQILIAMLIGAIIGLVINPGETSLDDVTVSVAKDQTGDGVTIAIQKTGESNAEPLHEERFKNIDSFRKRFPTLAEQLMDDETTRSITVVVTKRRVHLSEDGKKITLRYLRMHDGHDVVASQTAGSLKQLLKERPEWNAEEAEAITPYSKHIVRQVSVWAKYIGNLFLRMLRMITVPLIITSLVIGVAGLGNTSRLGAMFSRTMLYYVCTSIIAIVTGLVMVNLIQPGIGVDLPGGGHAISEENGQSMTGVFTNLANSMIPTNPVHAIANGEFLSIITFSILIGIFIIRVGGDSGKTMRDWFQSAFDVMMEMTQFIIRLAPIGVFAFMLFATASQGLEIFKIFAWYMLTVFLALLFHACVTMPLIVYFIGRRSPWEYAKAMCPALLTAFSTASSNATLPLTLTSVEERAGVSNRVSSFVLPLGATINMDGTALYEVVAVLFIAQAYNNGEPLSLGLQVTVAVTALFASVGAAGIPSAGLVMMAIVLQAVGLPLEAQGLIIAVDRVLDMCRTTVNVWSDSCGCAVLDRFEKGGASQASTS